MKPILLTLTILALSLSAAPAQARPHLPAKAAGAVIHGIGHLAEGVQRRHQRRVERRQSGRGVARALPRNW